MTEDLKEEKKPCVSVVIPVYNSAKFLSEAIDSIVNQTLQDIEIICVYDKSNDESLEILQQYAQKDNRVRVIINEEKKENNQYPVLFDLEKIYGGLIAIAEIIDENGNFITIEFDENIKTISLPYSGYYNINLYYKLKNGSNKGPISNSSFEYEKSFIF